MAYQVAVVSSRELIWFVVDKRDLNDGGEPWLKNKRMPKLVDKGEYSETETVPMVNNVMFNHTLMLTDGHQWLTIVKKTSKWSIRVKRGP